MEKFILIKKIFFVQNSKNILYKYKEMNGKIQSKFNVHQKDQNSRVHIH